MGGHNQPDKLPWHIWTHKDFHGCLKDLQIPYPNFDFYHYVSYILEGFRKECIERTKTCAKGNNCKQGTCKDAPNGYSCDCRGTGSMGDQCQLRM